MTPIKRCKRCPLIEFIPVTVLALGLYLPFLSIQYDPNGLIEAMHVENGPLLNKNNMRFIVWWDPGLNSRPRL